MTASRENQRVEEPLEPTAAQHGSGCVCNKLVDALDRHTEAHWHLHQIDAYYHHADPFRYSLNSFLRSIKEVPQIVQMQLQREVGFKKWFRSQREALHADPLFGAFSKHRDYLVHQGMLIPHSFAHVGTTRDGVRFKIGLPFGTNASEDSDRIMERFVEACREDDMLYGLAAGHGDDSQHPCVSRGWRLSSFPDVEVRALTLRAWLLVGKTINATLSWLGHAPLATEVPPCLADHAASTVQLKVYPQRIFADIIPPSQRPDPPTRRAPSSSGDGAAL